jgi:hypothetical protein
MLKKSVFVFFMVLCFTFPIASAIDLSVTSESGKVGNESKVDIILESDKEVFGVQMDISYDPRVLTFVRIEKGDYFNKDGGGSYDSNVLGGVHQSNGKIDNYIVVRGISESKGVSGSGRIASIFFRGVEVGKSDVTLSKVLLSDAGANSIPGEYGLSGGTIDVSDLAVESRSYSGNSRSLIWWIIGGVIILMIIILWIFYIHIKWYANNLNTKDGN